MKRRSERLLSIKRSSNPFYGLQSLGLWQALVMKGICTVSSGYYSNTAFRIVWDIFTCSKISYLHGHTSSIQDLTLNEERNHLISLGVDKVSLC